MTVKFVVECAACRWQTNEFERSEEISSYDEVPLETLLYFARHVNNKHHEYRKYTVTEVYTKLGHKVRVPDPLPF